MRYLFAAVLCVVAVMVSGVCTADTVTLTDGTVLTDCYARDEGIHLLVWEKMADVGTPKITIVPKSRLKDWKMERSDAWDVHPTLPDLSVTFIEMNPKLAGLHGVVQYDDLGRPYISGAKNMPNLDHEKNCMSPEEMVKGLKLAYKPGEAITLTAHVKNNGFAAAKPFSYVWQIDGKEVSKGKCDKSLAELAETTFEFKWKWLDGKHTVTFRIVTDQPEIATINNEATDPLWAWSYVFVVSPGRLAAWHKIRTAYGTFSFEDYYRWHVDMMNVIFAASKFPSTPDGIQARVRLDKIIYADDVATASRSLVDENGINYVQGMWQWQGEDEDKKNWEPPGQEGRNSTEWSLPHELGHQLGLIDWYNLDYDGSENHLWPGTKQKIAHFQNHSNQMMHWHGPNLWGEADAGYLNMTWNMPRGHFGDYVFAIPKDNYLRIVDVNGNGVPNAKIEIFQRGAAVDKDAPPGEDHGVTYRLAVEDGNFDNAVMDTVPMIAGTTDPDGNMHLPNRPVAEVITLNGYHRQPNPFGNINVVGGRAVMLVRVTKDDRPTWFYLEVFDFNVAWFRGHKDKFTITLKTPYRSESSPLPPMNVKATIDPANKDQAIVTWDPPTIIRERSYLDIPIGYRVYRRIGPMALNDRPWFPVATLGPDARSFTVNLKQRPEDVYWFDVVDCFAVSSLGELSVESELVERK